MPPRTALGFKLQPWVESNHIFLWISLHLLNSRTLPPAVLLHEKFGARLV